MLDFKKNITTPPIPIKVPLIPLNTARIELWEIGTSEAFAIS